jgi:hypothetical protein
MLSRRRSLRRNSRSILRQAAPVSQRRSTMPLASAVCGFRACRGRRGAGAATDPHPVAGPPAATVTPAARPLTQAAPRLAPLAPSGARGTPSSAAPVRSSAPAAALAAAPGRAEADPADGRRRLVRVGGTPRLPDARPAVRGAPAATPAPPCTRGRRWTPRRPRCPMTAAPTSAVPERLPMPPGTPAGAAGTGIRPHADGAHRRGHRHHDGHPHEPVVVATTPPVPCPRSPVARQRQDASAAGRAGRATTATRTRRGSPPRRRRTPPIVSRAASPRCRRSAPVRSGRP